MVCRPIARRVLGLLEARGARDPEIIDLVSSDPGLALPVLEAANRALAAAGIGVSSVEVALQVLGRGVCRTLIMDGLSRTPTAVDPAHLKGVRHAVVTSLAAGTLAEVLQFADRGEARVAGLLHGVEAMVGEPGYLTRCAIPPALRAAPENAGSGSSQREADEFLSSIVKLAHRMAEGLGAVDGCDRQRDADPEEDERLRGLGEMIHERVSREVADSLLVLGVLTGISRLDVRTFEESFARLMESEPEAAPPPEGLTAIIHTALDGVREAVSESAAIGVMMGTVRASPDVERALLVLEEAGEAMVSASEDQAPFFVRTRDLASISEGMSELMLLMQREGRAAVVRRGMGFDDVFAAFGAVEILAVPLHAGRRYVGAVLVPSANLLPAVLAPTLEVVSQSVGEALERIQLSRRSFLLTERITKDDLTEVLQRAHLMELLEAEIRVANRYGRPLAMVMLDVDNFKDWNDTYGHQVGDTLLRDVARVLKECSREGDLVGRYGGDEFISVLPGQSMEQAQAYAERVRERVESLGATMSEVCYDLQLSVSLGVAAATSHPVEAGTLLFRADHALYRAKDRGRNRVHAELP